MLRLMRLCCLCLLVLALPLQGLAAVAWLHGSPGHGPAQVMARAAADDGAAALPPCHGHQAASGDQTGPAASSHPGCSACAACGSHGTAPPAAMSQAPRLPLPVAAPAQGATPAVAPWVTEGIERPPRA